MNAPLARCVFCSGPGPFAAQAYGAGEVPAHWPPKHCFQDKAVALCPACGGGFIREAMTDAEISAFYAAVYTGREDAGSAAPERLHELTARFLSQVLYLKSFVDLRDGLRVLEFGPNVVSALPALSLFCKPSYRYFDQVESPVIASYGGRRLGPYANGAEVVRQVGEGGLDLVYASHSLEHVNPASLDELFAGLSLATAAGGHMFFEVPDDLAIQMLWAPHTLFFTRESIVRLLERHGFEIVHVGRWGAAAPAGPAHYTPAAAPKPTAKGALRRGLFSLPAAGPALRRFSLQRGLMEALKRLRTPYEPFPYFRVVARKC
ncbi:MAG TPA: methyltransferase domain-containing protein [Burkholderiales bacterium]|nr:methyltransferase domain-containing protein [Burkholderiales bacterium]